MTRFAEGTTVPPERSAAEIQQLLTRFGATAFAQGWTTGAIAIEFVARDRQIRVTVPLPGPTDRDVTHTPTGLRRPPREWPKRHQAEERRRWRALLLVLKAKLEAATSDITTFEEEFAMWTVLPDGSTVGERTLPAVADALATGDVAPVMAALAATRSRPALEVGR